MHKLVPLMPADFSISPGAFPYYTAGAGAGAGASTGAGTSGEEGESESDIGDALDTLIFVYAICNLHDAQAYARSAPGGLGGSEDRAERAERAMVLAVGALLSRVAGGRQPRALLELGLVLEESPRADWKAAGAVVGRYYAVANIVPPVAVCTTQSATIYAPIPFLNSQSHMTLQSILLLLLFSFSPFLLFSFSFPFFFLFLFPLFPYSPFFPFRISFGLHRQHLARRQERWEELSAEVKAALHAWENGGATSTSTTSREGVVHVAFYCEEYGNAYWPGWGPALAEGGGGGGGMGGSEEAILYTARELASRGVQVVVFAEQETFLGVDAYGVLWLPHWAFNPNHVPYAGAGADADSGTSGDQGPTSLFVAWRYASSLHLGTHYSRRLLWLHDNVGALLHAGVLSEVDAVLVQVRVIVCVVVCVTLHVVVYACICVVYAPTPPPTHLTR